MDHLQENGKAFRWGLYPPLDGHEKSFLETSSRSKRVQFAGHCFRATTEIISSLVLWKPKSVGRRSRKLSFLDTLKRDTNLNEQDLQTAMLDRECWRKIVKSIVSTAVEQ